MSEFKIQKAEGSYKLEDMQKRASVASTADGLTLAGPNFKLGCLTACPDMLLFACEELAKANEEYKNLFEIFESCQARMLRYKSAIDEECVLWDFTVDEKNPRKSIQRLLDITDAVARDPDVNSKARKFAIEKKCEGVQLVIDALASKGMLDTLISLVINSVVEQLRKEQE